MPRLWTHAFTSEAGYGNATGLALDASGNVIAVGQPRGDISIAGEPEQHYWWMYVAKLTPAGDTVFALPVGDPLSYAAPISVGVDASGNIYVLGYYQTTIEIESTMLEPEGEQGTFVAKLDPNGNLVWLEGVDATESEYPVGLEVLSNGDVLLVGAFTGQMYFGGNEVLSSPSANTTAIYMARLDSDFGHVWSKTAPRANLLGLDVGPDDELVLIETYDAAVDFGDGSLPQPVGGPAGFFALYDGEGAFLERTDALFPADYAATCEQAASTLCATSCQCGTGDCCFDGGDHCVSHEGFCQVVVQSAVCGDAAQEPTLLYQCNDAAPGKVCDGATLEDVPECPEI